MKRKSKSPTLDRLAPISYAAAASTCSLHEKLQDYVGYSLYKAAMQMKATVDRHLESFGLVSPQFGILVRLDFQGTKTQGELCQDMAMDKATMVRMIDGLEEKKFVTRVPSKTDRRANALELTKVGKQAMLKLHKARKAAEDEFLAPLSASERKQLTELVVRLMRRLED